MSSRPCADGGIKLQKKILNRLSVKVFLITFIVQILAGILICLALYFATPSTYRSTLAEDYLKVYGLVRDLRSIPEEKGGAAIDAFIRDTGIDIAVYRSNSAEPDFRICSDNGAKLTLTTDKEVETRMEKLSEKDNMGTFDFRYASDDSVWQDGNPRYRLTYFSNDSKENIMPLVIRKSLPVMIIVITGLSVLCSLIYTRLFARPVKELSEVSRSMAEMDFSRRCASERQDEIGDLARDLDVMADALKEKMESLEGKNQELSEEVSRRKELENQKDMFFSAASHELKTPVTVLEGQLRGMIEGIEPYTDHEIYLPKLLGTVRRMERLINEILMASRMQSGQEIVSSRTDMAQILEEKMEECEELFDVRGIEMELNLENDPGRLIFNGNRELTSIAVGAFVSNAAFYSGEGTKVVVDAEAVGDADGSGMVSVTIRNEGHIEKEDLLHIFEPFYRADKSRSRRSGGSGLGLYLAKLIVEKQGGSCKIENDGDEVLATIRLPKEGSEEDRDRIST